MSWLQAKMMEYQIDGVLAPLGYEVYVSSMKVPASHYLVRVRKAEDSSLFEKNYLTMRYPFSFKDDRIVGNVVWNVLCRGWGS